MSTLLAPVTMYVNAIYLVFLLTTVLIEFTFFLDVFSRESTSRRKYSRRIYSSSSKRLSLCRTYVSCHSLPYLWSLTFPLQPLVVDIWPGDDGFPIVTHGRTLTSKLTARDALSAIAKYAFLASPYPLILSIEIHCDPVQQDRLVEIFKETLGDRLLTERIDGKDGEIEVLPSPWDLRGKVLIKVRLSFST